MLPTLNLIAVLFEWLNLKELGLTTEFATNLRLGSDTACAGSLAWQNAIESLATVFALVQVPYLALSNALAHICNHGKTLQFVWAFDNGGARQSAVSNEEHFLPHFALKRRDYAQVSKEIMLR